MTKYIYRNLKLKENDLKSPSLVYSLRRLVLSVSISTKHFKS